MNNIDYIGKSMRFERKLKWRSYREIDIPFLNSWFCTFGMGGTALQEVDELDRMFESDSFNNLLTDLSTPAEINRPDRPIGPYINSQSTGHYLKKFYNRFNILTIFSIYL